MFLLKNWSKKIKNVNIKNPLAAPVDLGVASFKILESNCNIWALFNSIKVHGLSISSNIIKNK